jgi:hypothetical protein
MYYIISAYHEDTHFADCILNDTLPEFTPKQARGAVEVVLLGYLSARLGCNTTIEELRAEVNVKGSRHIIEDAMPFIRKNFSKLHWK